LPISVAIVGSGPAGFYTAEALLKASGDVRVDIIERLPTPFGLVRAGVAPDHQSTKEVARKFERTALREEVSYFGNVELGRDVSLGELRAMYDAVVLATGAHRDRPLNIPGEDKKGVYGSASFVGWYNGHPDFRDLNPALDTTAAAVIGNGNVALDVARVLVRSEAELAATDIADYAAQAIGSSRLGDIHIVGRRGPLEAKFANVELRELNTLSEGVPLADLSELPASVGELSDRERRLKAKNLETLREFAAHRPDEKPRRIHFRFFAKPVEILGRERVEGLRFERTRITDGRVHGTGEFFEIECGAVITAIGYCSSPIEGAPFDRKRCVVTSEDGRVAEGLYAVGWVQRGPSGVISSNRPEAAAVAVHIGQDHAGGGKPGRSALRELLGERGVRSVSYAEWKIIEAAEVARATPPAPRRKFTAVADMLAVLEEGRARRSAV